MKLILRIPNWVGDACMALPVVDQAKKLTRAQTVTLMARQSVASLFSGHPAVDKILVLDNRQSRFKELSQAISLISREEYNLGVILPPSFSSALIFKLGKVKERIGYKGDYRTWLLTQAAEYPQKKTHRSEQYLDLLATCSDSRPSIMKPHLQLTQDDLLKASGILYKHRLTDQSGVITIAPQATAPSRRWGTNNYYQLAIKLIRESGQRIILIGSKAEFEEGEKVRLSDTDKIVNLCGQTDLRTAAAILAQARLFIGNDSGLAHLAAAVGTRLVVLSGADDPEITSPVSDKKKVILKEIDCINCVKNVCPEKGDRFMRCMKLITVEEVFQAAQEILEDKTL